MDDLAVNELNRSECLALLAMTNLGQLALTRRALPAVIPAHYVVYRDRILIHASAALEPVPRNDGEIVALHASAFDADQRVGWSVSVTGVAHGRPDLAGIENMPHVPWSRTAVDTSSQYRPTSYTEGVSDQDSNRRSPAQ